MIAANLVAIGVESDVVAVENLGDFLRQASDPARAAAVLLGWTSDSGDPDDFLPLLLSCEAVGQSNRAQWCFQPFDDLLAEARSASSPAARARLYGEAQKMLGVHQPITAIAHTVVSVPMAASVSGFAASPLGHHNFEGVDVVEEVAGASRSRNPSARSGRAQRMQVAFSACIRLAATVE
jgi:dipeptide transport system substrate-binding protein